MDFTVVHEEVTVPVINPGSLLDPIGVNGGVTLAIDGGIWLSHPFLASKETIEASSRVA